MAATVHQAPLPKFQFNQNGIPLAGGRLFTYISGTTTKLATYTSSAGTTTNLNPIILDSNGGCDIWLIAGDTYTFVLSPATDADPPTNPFWTENGIVGINDVSTTSAPVAPGSGVILQTGDIKTFDYASSNLAPGWLLCTGAPVSRTTYATLFARVGTIWGVGDGTTTFNLPDRRGRVTFGADNMGGTAAGRLTSASIGVAAVQGAVGGDQMAQADTINVTDPGHLHGLLGGAIAPGGAFDALTPTPGGVTANTSSAVTGISVAGSLTGGAQNIPPALVTNFAIWSGSDISIVNPASAPSGLPIATATQTYGGTGTAGLAVAVNIAALPNYTFGQGATVTTTADTYYFTANTPSAGTILNARSFVASGTETYTIKINGVAVTGLTSIAETVTSGAPATHASSGANTFAAGALLSMTVTGTAPGFCVTLGIQ